MAERKSSRGRSPESFDSRKMVRGEDIISGAASLLGTEDYSEGYPETFNSNMHINRDRPAVEARRGK